MSARAAGAVPQQAAREELLREHLTDLASGGLDLAAFPLVSAWACKLLPA